MIINLIASDAETYELCRDILAEVAELGQSWTLQPISAKEAWRQADLDIWDFNPELTIPEPATWNPVRHLFLVDRQDLPAFQERIGALDANVLLKPVVRTTLRTFLVPTISARGANSLRVERDEILQCLIQTNLKLQEYDQDRTTFLARAVHDFRAPLTALSGYCGLLLSESPGPLNETQNEILRRMRHSAKRLSRMASAMFELSTGPHVKRRLELQPGDMRESLEQAMHEIAPFADEKSISITVDLAPADPGLYFEAAQIEQVLINILDNACKFTPKGSAVEIRGYPYFWERRRHATASVAKAAERRTMQSHEPNSYRVDIGDAGLPIPEEHLERIFEEYTSYAGHRDRSGGGLGLAICKRIITQHEGSIWADNGESGPVFSFVLPMRGIEYAYPSEAGNHNRLGGRLNAEW